MKQYFSVWMIAARSTIYKIMGLLFAMAALEVVLFYNLLRRASDGELYPLELLIDQSRIPLVCGVAFLLLCVLLSLVGCEFGSKTGYTIRRLSVREEEVTLLWAGYNMVCFLIFWAVQLLIALLLCHWYIAVMEPVYWNEQTIFLAFYRNDFLHSLLPLAEISRWIRNGALIFALSLAPAHFAQRQRRGQKGIAVVVLAVITVMVFPFEMGNAWTDAFITLFAVAAGGHLCDGILAREKK